MPYTTQSQQRGQFPSAMGHTPNTNTGPDLPSSRGMIWRGEGVRAQMLLELSLSRLRECVCYCYQWREGGSL